MLLLRANVPRSISRTKTTCSLRTKKVLVGDENAHSRELLRILLEHQGCEVSEAANGRQAVAMAHATVPDLVLLDLELPDLGGYAALLEMRRDKRLKRSSIAALIPNVWDGDDDDLRKAGFSGSVTKPVFLRVLTGQLARLLRA